MLMDFNIGSGYVYGQPYVPPPRVRGVMTNPGAGKTHLWRKKVAAPLIAKGMCAALFVSRHQLGEEIVRDLAKDGIEARVYYGRQANDPLAPGFKMCREQERIGAIGQAYGSVPERACKNGNRQCQHFDTAGISGSAWKRRRCG